MLHRMCTDRHTTTCSMARKRVKQNSYVCILVLAGGGGGGTLILSYIHRLGSFLGFKILNSNIFFYFFLFFFYLFIFFFWGGVRFSEK